MKFGQIFLVVVLSAAVAVGAVYVMGGLRGGFAARRKENCPG
jgi:hypothetical protein